MPVIRPQISGSSGPALDLWGDVFASLDWESDIGDADVIANGDGVKYDYDSGTLITMALNADTPSGNDYSFQANEGGATAFVSKTPSLSGHAAITAATDFTIMFWFKKLNRNTWNDQFFGFGQGGGPTSNGMQWTLTGDPATSNSLYLRRIVSSSHTNVTRGFWSNILNWNLCVIRWDETAKTWQCSANTTHYAPVDGSSLEPFWGANHMFKLGKGTTWSSGAYCQGFRLDACRGFTRVLTDAEVEAHYNSGTALDYLENP